MKRDDISSLAHSKWIFKYHVVVCTKVQEKGYCGKLRKNVKEILRKLYEEKESLNNQGGNLS